MRAVHVRIGHDDNAAVAQLRNVEARLVFAFRGAFYLFFWLPDPCADRGDHGLDLGVLEKLIDARFLDVDQLAADRQDRLVTPVASLFRGATRGIALDDVKLGQFRIALRTIGQFSRKPATGEGAFADCLPRFAGGFAGARRRQNLVENSSCDRRVLIEEGHQPFVDDRVHDAVDLGVHELHLGLRFEARVRQLDAQHAGQTFANVVTGNSRVLIFR